MIRKCVACQTNIFECMGFGFARDMFNRQEFGDPFPREICGTCGTVISLYRDLEKNNEFISDKLKQRFDHIQSFYYKDGPVEIVLAEMDRKYKRNMEGKITRSWSLSRKQVVS